MRSEKEIRKVRENAKRVLKKDLSTNVKIMYQSMVKALSWVLEEE
jgi:hypothetical protein